MTKKTVSEAMFAADTVFILVEFDLLAACRNRVVSVTGHRNRRALTPCRGALAPTADPFASPLALKGQAAAQALTLLAVLRSGLLQRDCVVELILYRGSLLHWVVLWLVSQAGISPQRRRNLEDRTKA